uniref:Cleavage and polyadenylation specificity factor subunit 4 n=1 Tax=Monodon monoceros TaxID=40151 RepID=A0A8C6BUX0_MONMO
MPGREGEKMVVCKHWLRGLCKKGDQCKFLHQYDVTRMPVCYFYSKFGDCSNKECPFLHVKPALKTRDCPWYDQGFCKDAGPLCKYRHVRRIMCINYSAGFCPEGPKCQFAHPKMNLLFNPSYLKVSAGRRGADVAHSFTARFPGEPLLPSPALFPDALTLTPSAPRILGKAHIRGRSSQTPSDLRRLCFRQSFSAPEAFLLLSCRTQVWFLFKNLGSS